MCDTIVALGSATADGLTLFAKNADREPDETHNLEVHPGGTHAPGQEVECTYLRIPQVERTYRVLISRPFWMFGAEMGVNEHGVAIGNEALFTREKPGPAGLTGMDLLRLALERSRTAAEGRDTIISLLEAHGQGGRCGYRQGLFYMNGFLIADPEDAYVLETIKQWWAWKKVRETWSISNIISLTDDFDQCSPGLIAHAVKKGWCKRESDFNFRRCCSDRLFTHFAQGRARQCRSRELLAKKAGRLETSDFMAMLRDHGTDTGWRPDRQRGGTLCMHAANPLTRPTQATSSLMAKLGKNKKFFWATGAATPCLSPFFPVFLPEADLPRGYRPGGEFYDPEAYWWESERINRQALSAFSGALDFIRPLLAQHESEMVSRIESGAEPMTQEVMDAWFEKARNLKRGLGKKLPELPPEQVRALYRLWWRRLNRRNRIPDGLTA